MRTDYFDDLLPDSVTHVTQPKIKRVTPEPGNVTSENKGLIEASRVSRMSRTKTSNTEQRTEQSAKRYAYRFRLHNDEGGGLYLTDDTDLDRARASLLKLYGDRLATVVKA